MKEFPGQAVEIHMDNARIHSRINDFNPKGDRGKKAALQKYDLDLFGELRWGFGAVLASATKPELVCSISAAAGMRVQGPF